MSNVNTYLPSHKIRPSQLLFYGGSVEDEYHKAPPPIIEQPKPNEVELMRKITEYLDNVKKFPSKDPTNNKDTSRQNIFSKSMMGKPIEAFVFGKVKQYYVPKDKMVVDSSITKSGKYQELYDMLKELIKIHNPNFKYTSIQINKSVKTDWHFDKGNVGLSYCLALGKFSGGGVVVRLNPNETKKYDNHNKWLYYDGHYLKHKSAGSVGTRYAIIFYTFATK